MACSRGCCASPADHYRSVRVGAADRAAMTRTRVDDHGGGLTVAVTDHYAGDRRDVTIRPPTAARQER